jgi:hypothetical protein
MISCRNVHRVPARAGAVRRVVNASLVARPLPGRTNARPESHLENHPESHFPANLLLTGERKRAAVNTRHKMLERHRDPKNPTATNLSVIGPAATNPAVIGPAATNPAATNPTVIGRAGTNPTVIGLAATNLTLIGPATTSRMLASQRMENRMLGRAMPESMMPGSIKMLAMSVSTGLLAHQTGRMAHHHVSG